MPLPGNAELTTLDASDLGQPFVQIEAKRLNTELLDIAYLGEPFVAVGPPDSATSQLNVFVNVSGTWTQASAIYVNVSGTWQTVTAVSANVSGAWKS